MKVVSYDQWREIDEEEREEGRRKGKPREKKVDYAKLTGKEK